MFRRKTVPPDRVGWFAVRRELPPRRRALLTLLSFFGPLLLWCAVSYLPFIWHPEVQLTLAADRDGVTTSYSAGDRLSRDYFPEYVRQVMVDNAAIRAAHETGDSLEVTRRTNLRNLRQIVPWGMTNGYLTQESASDDSAMLRLWARAAQGDTGKRLRLSRENREIAATNWDMITTTATDPFDPRQLPTQPLLKLLPQGERSNPVYLPTPGDVIRAGWRDFTTPASAGGPALGERLRHSMRIVFGGFLLAALIGVPIGILCGTFDFFSRLIEPFVDFFRYMPAPAFSTLLVAIFLAHDAPKIALVFVGTFFQLVLVVANTARGLDHSLLEAAQTLGARQPQLLLRVIVPGILPRLYNDLRILLGWAWTWLVIAELIGVKSGLTEFIETQGRWRNFERVYPVIILIGFIGFFTDQILAALRPFLFRWTGDMPGQGAHGLATSVVAGPRWLTRTLTEGRLDAHPKFLKR